MVCVIGKRMGQVGTMRKRGALLAGLLLACSSFLAGGCIDAFRDGAVRGINGSVSSAVGDFLDMAFSNLTGP